MILLLFALMDMAAGISLAVPNVLGLYVGIVMILKGLYSSVSSLSMGEAIFSVLGIIDIIAGLVLVFSIAFPWLWLLILIKGSYSLLIGLNG